MSILNKVWNHYDAWSGEKSVVTGLTRTWGETLKVLAENNERGYDDDLSHIHRFVGENDNGSTFNLITSLHHQVSCMMEYRRWGQQTVVVGPEMQKAFGDTELGKVPASHLKMPFPACWVAFPDNKEMLLWGGTPTEEVGGGTRGTGWHNVQGAYVIDLAHVSNGHKKGLLVYLWAPDPIDETIRAKNRALGSPNVLTTDDMANMWFTLPLEEGKDIEESITETFDSPLNEVFDHHPLDPNRKIYEKMSALNSGEEVQRVVSNAALTATRIIINSALYMVSPKADLMGIKSQKREDLLDQAKDLRDQEKRASGKAARNWRRQAEKKERKAKRYKPPVTWIGPHIEKKIAEGKSKGGVRDSKQKGHVRKGHWHMFRTGRMKDEEGMKIPNELRNYIYHWVAPTWCGDLDTKHEKHTHAFKEL